MAKRFGGKYSPDGSFDGQGVPQAAPRVGPGQAHHPYESRTGWVTAMATPMLLGAFFQGDPTMMATHLAGFGLIAGAMYLTREGLQAEAAYDARRVAKRPAIPRKLFGGIVAGLGLAIGAADPGAVAGAGVLGVTGAILHWLAFGPDPMHDKGMEGIDGFQQDRAARMVAEAEGHLQGMADAILRTADRRLEARVAGFAATVRTIFVQVEQDPADLAAARRYLGVYLLGARDATAKFADLYAQTRDPRARADYEALLDDLERNFRALEDKLRQSGQTDMDIEIQVLRERLAREGIATPAAAPAAGGTPVTPAAGAHPWGAAAEPPARPALEQQPPLTAEELFRLPERDKTR